MEHQSKNYEISNVDLEFKAPNSKTYLIVLNSELQKNLTKHLILISDVIICGDGGANQLFNSFSTEERQKYVPDFIIGDLDSIDLKVKSFYEGLNVKVIQNDDQNSTDLDKIFEILIPEIIEEKREFVSIRIIITGCLGTSRMDHNLANMSHLIKYSKFFDAKAKKYITLQIMHGNSLISCILPGNTCYKVSNMIEEKNGVGLIPLCGQCDFIETKGLKWNLGSEVGFYTLKMGEKISSSNEFDKSIIEIKNSEVILFCSNIRQSFLDLLL